MVSRIVSFGDSVMYGTELPYDDDDIRPLVEELTRGLARDHTGALRQDEITPALVDRKEAMEEAIEDYNERCNLYSMSGYLSTRLGIPHCTYSYGGYGNDAIMSEIIMHRDELDRDTFVIVGLTYHSRRTRLAEKTLHGRIVSVNNYAASNRDQIRYLELEDRFGDDLLVRYLQVRNHLSAVHELLDGIPHVVIDPVNTYRENPELSGKIFGWGHDRCIANALERQGDIIKPDLADAIQRYFNERTFLYTLNHAMLSVMREGRICRQPFLHPTKEVHERFVDSYLIPWMEEHGFA